VEITVTAATVIVAVVSLLALFIGVGIGYFYWKDQPPRRYASELIPEVSRPAFTPPTYTFSKTVIKTKRAKPGRKPAPVDVDAVLSTFEKEGTVNGTAKALDLRWAQVKKVLKAAGIENEKQPTKLHVDVRRRVQEALASGERSQRSVAEEFGLSQSAVCAIAKESL